MKHVCALLVLSMGACRAEPPEPSAIRLTDSFEPQHIISGSAPSKAPPPPEEWTFQKADHGWKAGVGVSGLALVDGHLAGRATTETPVLHVERSPAARSDEPLHAVEVRLRASAGTRLRAAFQQDERLDLQSAVLSGWFETPLIAGDDFTTYTLSPRGPRLSSSIRHVLLYPSNAKDSEFEVESIRLVFRSDHLADIPSGVSWQGVSEVYRETLVARTGETIAMDVDLPSRPWLDLSLATVDPEPVTFRVGLARASEGTTEVTLLHRTITRSEQWESAALDLAMYAGERVRLQLSLEGDAEGVVGFWGATVIRNRREARTDAPQGVILFVADTLRTDHLEAWGYHRPTAPHLAEVAAGGVTFENALAQATWTKVSATSILTSLYPTSHGVLDFPDRLPASAETLAEVFRDAGYATIALLSNGFAGKFTNLHQGFETVYETGAFHREQPSKSARAVVDRLLPWLEAHRDVPFFVYIHVVDPHSPFAPYPPYDAMWFDPAQREEHERQQEAIRPLLEDPLAKAQGLPNRAELERAKVDAATFVRREHDWYDGSIRAMDVELKRLSQRLDELGLEDDTLLGFISDHGEEFLEHGMHFHGQSVYSELTNVPFVLSWPGRLPRGLVVQETVQSIDLMPTLLELTGLPVPAGVQGRSLVPLVLPEESEVRWSARPAFSEDAHTTHPLSPMMRELEAYAIVSDRWKLIHNVEGRGGRPEFELFDREEDPLDARNVAEAHPDVVKRLSEQIDAFRQMAAAARLASDGEATEGMTSKELERLRSLGYVQ